MKKKSKKKMSSDGKGMTRLKNESSGEYHRHAEGYVRKDANYVRKDANYQRSESQWH